MFELSFRSAPVIMSERDRLFYGINPECKFCDGSMIDRGHQSNYRIWVCDKCHAMAKGYYFGEDIIWEKYGEAKVC